VQSKNRGKYYTRVNTVGMFFQKAEK